MTSLNMQIKLTVMAARNVKIGDITKTSDCYMKIQTRNNKFITSVTKPTLNPTWMQSFTFESTPDEEITFILYDKDKYTNDDKLGTIKYTIPALVNDDTIYEIKKFNTKGLFYFSLTCLKGGISKIYKNPIPNDRMILKISQIHMGYCTFHAEYGSYSTNNYSFKMGVSSQHTPEARTDRTKEMYNGHFDQFFLVEVEPEEKLHFTMYFKQVIGLIKKRSAEGDWRVPDMRDGEVIFASIPSKNYATFHCKIECLKGIYHDAFLNQIPPENDIGNDDIGRYQITVVKGENFIQTDYFSPSDPCVYIKTDYNKTWRTTFAQMDCNSPEWNQTFKLKCHPGDTVHVECNDYDTFTDNDSLGKGEFQIPKDLKEEESKEIKCPISLGENCNVYFDVKRMRDVSSTYLKLKKGEVIVGDPNVLPKNNEPKVDFWDDIVINIL